MIREFFEESQHLYVIKEGSFTLGYYMSRNMWADFEDQEWVEIHDGTNFWSRNCPQNWIIA